MNDKIYYELKNDIEKFKKAWAYLIFGGRSTGKTYSALNYCIQNNTKFLFIKRTKRDVNFICKCSQNNEKINVDISPFKPLNRDFNYNIFPYLLDDGFGSFFKFENDEPTGEPVGYICALSMVKDIKGFDLSDCDLIIFDEFIPKKWERIYNKREGDDLLDIYMTLRRDRINRGREELKLICLANGVNISNSVFNILEVVDDVATMPKGEDSIKYIEDRGILLHKIPSIEEEEKELSGIEKAMRNTEWYEMSFEGDFAFDDFSNVQKINLKSFSPVCEFIYKRKKAYIYKKEYFYYITNKKSGIFRYSYDLGKENKQKLFYYDIVTRVREACIDGNAIFSKYTYYDLIVNYKKFYTI